MKNHLDKYKVDVPEGSKGDWHVEKFEVKKTDIGALRAAISGRYIPEGTYTRLRHSRRGVVMSDTPSEIRDHLHYISMAKGRCLIHGLGLGMVLGALLNKDKVTHVDVVELEQDVIDLVAPSYEDPRVKIHQGDAYTFKFPKGNTWDYAWHDIWDDICTDNLPQMTKLHRRYGKKVVWQDSWQRDRLKSLKRREKILG